MKGVKFETATAELEAVQRVLQEAVDREPGSESAFDLAVIAANGIHWRNKRLNQCERILGDISMLLRKDMLDDQQTWRESDDVVHEGQNEGQARHESPPIGARVLCLVCAYDKPWGLFHEPSGVAVCMDCKTAADAARQHPEPPSTSRAIAQAQEGK